MPTGVVGMVVASCMGVGSVGTAGTEGTACGLSRVVMRFLGMNNFEQA